MSGSFVSLDYPWYETRILNCAFCGKMIAGQYWHDDSFPDDKFCEPSCVALKRRMKRLPRRARDGGKEKRN
jgi:hypothetical protein